MIRNYGQKNRYEHEVYGLNSRLDEIQAAILSIELKYLDKFNKKRNILAKTYYRLLKNVKYIQLPQIRPHSTHNFHLFVIEAHRRDELMEFLASYKIPTLIHYPIPIHKQKCFSEYNNLSLPIIEDKVQKILSLPIHTFLTNKEIIFISNKIIKFYEI